MDVARATSSPTRSSILRSTPCIGERTQADFPAWTEARLVKSALIRMTGCLVFKAASCLTALDDGLAFLLGAAIGATPAHDDPLWMLVDPLRDVGLRIHDALIERHVGRERNMLIFALAGSDKAQTVTTSSIRPILESPLRIEDKSSAAAREFHPCR